MGGLESEVAAGGCGFGSRSAEGEVGAEGVVDARGGGGAELEVGVGGVVGGGDDAEGLRSVLVVVIRHGGLVEDSTYHDDGVERCSVVV